MGAKIDSDYLRAAYTGLAVLAIARSKILQIKGADIGFEYFYSELRAKTLGSILADWTEHRNKIIRERLDDMFTHPNIDLEIIELIQSNIEFAEVRYKDSVTSQLNEARRNRPSSSQSNTDPDWRAFYRTLLNLALTNCGAEALERKFERRPGQ